MSNQSLLPDALPCPDCAGWAGWMADRESGWIVCSRCGYESPHDTVQAALDRHNTLSRAMAFVRNLARERDHRGLPLGAGDVREICRAARDIVG